MTPDFWRNRRVVVTGHTGFKGSWLCLWLDALGAKVTGISLPAESSSLFVSAGVEQTVDHCIADITALDPVNSIFARAEPEIVFHLAAESLVRRSYEQPISTLATNVIGTAHILEAARAVPSVRAVVVVTSDKCYENRERPYGLKETDPMGGNDPYSASKGCAELVTHAWRGSFFGGRMVASGRAGNVIGGGDWAADRLVPDLMRGFANGTSVGIRNPSAVRPWQHVLEPLHGYLLLAEQLCGDAGRFAEGWNFGPESDSVVTVAELADRLVELWGEAASWHVEVNASAPHEAMTLQLDSSKARSLLKWRSAWSFTEGLKATVDWYKAHATCADLRLITQQQIEHFSTISQSYTPTTQNSSVST